MQSALVAMRHCGKKRGSAEGNGDLGSELDGNEWCSVHNICSAVLKKLIQNTFSTIFNARW